MLNPRETAGNPRTRIRDNSTVDTYQAVADRRCRVAEMGIEPLDTADEHDETGLAWQWSVPLGGRWLVTASEVGGARLCKPAHGSPAGPARARRIPAGSAQCSLKVARTSIMAQTAAVKELAAAAPGPRMAQPRSPVRRSRGDPAAARCGRRERASRRGQRAADVPGEPGRPGSVRNVAAFRRMGSRRGLPSSRSCLCLSKDAAWVGDWAR